MSVDPMEEQSFSVFIGKQIFFDAKKLGLKEEDKYIIEFNINSGDDLKSESGVMSLNKPIIKNFEIATTDTSITVN